MRSDNLRAIFESIIMHVNATDMAMRGSGRTYHLLDQHKDGDLIVCTPQEFAFYRSEMRRRRKDENCVIAVPPHQIERLDAALAGRKGYYVHFSHEFVRLALIDHLEGAGNRFARIFAKYQDKPAERPVGLSVADVNPAAGFDPKTFLANF